MPFTKGIKKHPASGMKPGQKSAKTLAWERLGEYVIGAGCDRYLALLNDIPDKEFAAEYRAIIEYFKPKLQRAEVKQETTLTELRPMPKIYIGFSEEEEAELRRADEQETEIPGSIPLPKININRRDNEEEKGERGGGNTIR